MQATMHGQKQTRLREVAVFCNYTASSSNLDQSKINDQKKPLYTELSVIRRRIKRRNWFIVGC